MSNLSICGLEGVVICGNEDYWIQGPIYITSLTMQQEIIDCSSLFDTGWKTHRMGVPSLTIEATSLDQFVITDDRPKMMDEASILELVRAANRKIKERST